MSTNPPILIDAAAPAVCAKKLTIGYPRETVVSEITVSVPRGDSLALVGVNGSGKSTLLKTLVGLIPALAGELEVVGALPGKAPRQIAYLSQFHNAGFILPLRAVDAVRMGRYANHGLLGRMTSEDDDLVREAMQRMGIWNLAGMPLRTLSGGQQQRIFIAQALARRANLLALDEPTAGLDAAGKELYQQALRDELCRGASVVIATHDIEDAMLCDQAMLLARKVIALGPGAEVITPEALLQAFGVVITMNKQQEMGIAVVEREHGHGC